MQGRLNGGCQGAISSMTVGDEGVLGHQFLRRLTTAPGQTWDGALTIEIWISVQVNHAFWYSFIPARTSDLLTSSWTLPPAAALTPISRAPARRGTQSFPPAVHVDL